MDASAILEFWFKTITSKSWWIKDTSFDQLKDKGKSFLYMPFMHSESLFIHQQALKLFSEPGLEGNTEFEKRRFAIIDHFGRYPHRNKILGRGSAAEELDFLEQPGSAF